MEMSMPYLNGDVVVEVSINEGREAIRPPFMSEQDLLGLASLKTTEAMVISLFFGATTADGVSSTFAVSLGGHTYRGHVRYVSNKLPGDATPIPASKTTQAIFDRAMSEIASEIYNRKLLSSYKINAFNRPYPKLTPFIPIKLQHNFEYLDRMIKARTDEMHRAAILQLKSRYAQKVGLLPSRRLPSSPLRQAVRFLLWRNMFGRRS